MVGLYVGFQYMAVRQQKGEIYVSTGYTSEDGKIKLAAGSDGNPGTARQPFKTIERARTEIRRSARGKPAPVRRHQSLAARRHLSE